MHNYFVCGKIRNSDIPIKKYGGIYITNINQCMEFINSYSKSGGKITDLSRAEELMDSIGNPEKRLKFVHIAGTNGKGSTLEYISNALIFSGYKTGQFTSPFILKYNDRMRINGNNISDEALCEIAGFVRDKVSDREYSQFEITMAIALLWFEREKCDIVILETGIGGLLDCTNVIPPPLLSVITSISLDHTALLGDTVEEIAMQKAGIIKENSAVAVSPDNKENVIDIMLKTAKSKNAEFLTHEDTSPYGDGGLYAAFIYKNQRYQPAMAGLHQYYNSITALTACCYLRKKGFDIPDENIKKSIETTQVMARVQMIDGKPPVIVDGGHNPSGASMLALTLMYLGTRGHKIYTVMGMVSSKDYCECVKAVAPLSDNFTAVDDFAPNAVKAEDIADIAAFYTNAATAVSLEAAVEKSKALALENDGIVVVCGSLYLAGEYLGMK
ncbi:MAG: bifunctional tetrahydrofolate synthase/dihydrofolate synthase [Ruminococcus sp.]|nr:bifunctional tetrahydrofolate synthase/dihydrofolate synthase [Ruminococcus sp.]